MQKQTRPSFLASLFGRSKKVAPKNKVKEVTAPRPFQAIAIHHGTVSCVAAQVVPRTRAATATERAEVSVSDRQRAMSWAQRLRRVFAIDIETCRQCGGKLRVIASIEQPAVIERILDHLGHIAETVDPAHPGRAPPTGDRFV